MEFKILNTIEDHDSTIYTIRFRKNDLVFSDIISATHWKSRNYVDIQMPKGHTVRLRDVDDPIQAIKDELAVSV